MLLFWLLCTLIVSVMYSDCLTVYLWEVFYQMICDHEFTEWQGRIWPWDSGDRCPHQGRRKREKTRKEGEEVAAFFWICPHQNSFFVFVPTKKNPRYASGRTGSESKLTQFQRFKISNYCPRSCRRCQQPLQIKKRVKLPLSSLSFPQSGP